MMMLPTKSPLVVELTYVGNKQYKQDNVAKTGTTWFGFGDTQPVERKHIPEFLKHPDVWMLKAEFDKRYPNFVLGEEVAAPAQMVKSPAVLSFPETTIASDSPAAPAPVTGETGN